MQQLPDVASVLVEHLVHHGMEHDDESVRLWSTLTSSRLLVSIMTGGQSKQEDLFACSCCQFSRIAA